MWRVHLVRGMIGACIVQVNLVREILAECIGQVIFYLER